jgi:hypothetical protein
MMNESTRMDHRVDVAGRFASPVIIGELLMASTCGVLSEQEDPSSVLAPESFRKGPVDGYFSGDGLWREGVRQIKVG